MTDKPATETQPPDSLDPCKVVYTVRISRKLAIGIAAAARDARQRESDFVRNALWKRVLARDDR